MKDNRKDDGNFWAFLRMIGKMHKERAQQKKLEKAMATARKPVKPKKPKALKARKPAKPLKKRKKKKRKK